MSIQSLAQVVGASKAASIQPKLPRFIIALVLIFLSVTVLILGVGAIASAQALPQLPELPPAYLPGNPLPKDVSCSIAANQYIISCSIRSGDDEIFFNSDSAKTISHTLIPAQKYTIGQVIAAWGTPTGITHRETQVYVHWGARSALLYTKAFQPDSIVEFIVYDLEPPPSSPWRGFRLFE
jgi:hypothetical protein